MLVKLPRECSGQEVVDAFTAASTFQEGPKKRWVAHEYSTKFQYGPNYVGPTARSVGVRVYSDTLRRTWLLTGENVWKPDFNPMFTLIPLVLSNRYDEVKVAVEYVFDVDMGGGEYVATCPRTPQFEHIRPLFERILGGFYDRLQPQRA